MGSQLGFTTSKISSAGADEPAVETEAESVIFMPVNIEIPKHILDEFDTGLAALVAKATAAVTAHVADQMNTDLRRRTAEYTMAVPTTATAVTPPRRPTASVGRALDAAAEVTQRKPGGPPRLAVHAIRILDGHGDDGIGYSQLVATIAREANASMTGARMVCRRLRAAGTAVVLGDDRWRLTKGAARAAAAAATPHLVEQITRQLRKNPNVSLAALQRLCRHAGSSFGNPAFARELQALINQGRVERKIIGPVGAQRQMIRLSRRKR